MVAKRLIRLPEPYPDENCYSILCRYAVRTGSLSSFHLSVMLYGNTMPLTGLMYKPFRTTDIERWTGTGECGIRYGEDHSCLQYFSVFMESEDSALLKTCIDGMATPAGQTKRISRKCSLTQIRKERLWYCPACVTEDFRAYGETYWRRLHQMPGVSYCPVHRIRLCESGLPVKETNYRIFPASYVLIHMPEETRDYSGDIFEREFIRIAEDTMWLLDNGFLLPDNSIIRSIYTKQTGSVLQEHTVRQEPGRTGSKFENYLAARFLKESGRSNVGLMTQKYLSTIVSIDRSYGSFEKFWQNAR